MTQQEQAGNCAAKGANHASRDDYSFGTAKMVIPRGGLGRVRHSRQFLPVVACGAEIGRLKARSKDNPGH